MMVRKNLGQVLKILVENNNVKKVRKKNNLRIGQLFLIFIIYFLSGCTNDSVCYDAVDWGSPVATVNSNPTPCKYAEKNNYQITPWQASGYYLNGKEIYFVVQNTYSYYAAVSASENPVTPKEYFKNSNNYSTASGNAFYQGWSYLLYDPGCSGSGTNVSSATVGAIISSSGMCKFASTGNQATCPICPQASSGSTGSNINPCPSATCAPLMSQSLPITNGPCFLANGMGVYVGFSQSQSPQDAQLVGRSVHLGQSNLSSSPFYNLGVPTGGVAMSLGESNLSGCLDGSCGVFFKMLDKYYDDNYGGISIALISGVDDGNPGIITRIVAFIQGSLCWARDTIYQNLVAESGFQTYVRTLLLLYIIIYGITFLMGLAQITQKELMMRAFKIAIVIQLISPNSWSFFNDYFFQFFTQGIGEITGMLFGENGASIGSSVSSSGSISNCPCTFFNLAGFEAFDSILHKLFSQATQAKLKSMIYWSPFLGSVYYLVINVIFLILIYILIKSVFVYIMAYLALSLIIVLAPIFIPCMLFNFTKSFFSNWLKQLISYFIQPIVILTFTFFIFQLITNQIYNLFGYTVCKSKWFSIGLPVAGFNYTAYMWKAETGPTYNSEPVEIVVPNFHYYCDSSAPKSCNVNPYAQGCENHCHPCGAFECTGLRYPKYPYLDPNTDYGQDRLKALEAGTIIEFTDILLLCFMIWFMMKFNELVPGIAKDLAGTPMQMADMSAAAGGMRISLIKGAGGLTNELIKKATKGNVDIARAGRIAGSAANKFRVGIGKIGYNAQKLHQRAEGAVMDVIKFKTQAKFAAKAAKNIALAPAKLAYYKAKQEIGKGIEPNKEGDNKWKAGFKKYTGLDSAARFSRKVEDSGGLFKYGLKRGKEKYITTPITNAAAKVKYNLWDNPKYQVKKLGYKANRLSKWAQGKELPKPPEAPQKPKSGGKGKQEVYRSWYKQFRKAQNAIGGFSDTLYHAPKRALQQALHDKTFGILGKDHAKEERKTKEREEDEAAVTKALGMLTLGSVGDGDHNRTQDGRDISKDAKHDYWSKVAEQHRINMEKLGKKSSNIYDNTFRRVTGNYIKDDSASGAPLVGGRYNAGNTPTGTTTVSSDRGDPSVNNRRGTNDDN